MIYAIAGSSGSGKSTLAAACAEYMDMTYVPTSITDMARRAGFDPVAPMDLEQRMLLQEALLVQFEKLVAGCAGPCILDRSPLDLAMYMMAEVGMNSGLTQGQHQQVMDYIGRCLALAGQRFDHIFITTPLGYYEEAATRPRAGGAYHAHCYLLMIGLASEMEGFCDYTILGDRDHESRMEVVCDHLEERLDEIETERRHSAHLH